MNHLIKLVLLLILSFPCAAKASTPEDFVNQTAQNVMTILNTQQDDVSKKQDLTKLFLKTMDVEWIARFVLGRNWLALSDQEKNDYINAYREYLIATYVPLFKKYNGQKIVINGVTPLETNNYQVLSQIVAQDKVITVEYRLVRLGSEFRVRDISAEGISLLQTQRSDFASVIANGGITALIERLNAKAASSQ